MTKQRRRRFNVAERRRPGTAGNVVIGPKLIGRVFGKNSSSIFAHLRPHGGIRMCRDDVRAEY
jgi:hypothetical protein